VSVQPGGTEPDIRAEVAQYLNDLRKKNDPAYHSFAEFMASLPLEQQRNVVRFCMHENIAPNNPLWIIFALAQSTSVSSIQRLRSASKFVESAAVRIEESANTLDGKLERAVERAMQTPEERKAERDSLRSDVRNAFKAERANVSTLETSLKLSATLWTVWACMLVAAALLAFWYGAMIGQAQGYRLSREYLESRISHEKRALLNNLMVDRRLRDSPAWRRIIQDRINKT